MWGVITSMEYGRQNTTMPRQDVSQIEIPWSFSSSFCHPPPPIILQPLTIDALLAILNELFGQYPPARMTNQSGHAMRNR